MKSRKEREEPVLNALINELNKHLELWKKDETLSDQQYGDCIVNIMVIFCGSVIRSITDDKHECYSMFCMDLANWLQYKDNIQKMN